LRGVVKLAVSARCPKSTSLADRSGFLLLFLLLHTGRVIR
jgi:hypothetical protein